jgi:hypothetical protein
MKSSLSILSDDEYVELMYFDWNEKQKLCRGPSKEPAKFGSNWPSGFRKKA